MKDIQVEICCNSVRSAANALSGGAQRVELCQDLGGGGTTPSAAAIEYCVQHGLRTHVLIRPNTGNFCYNDDEFCVILRDIEYAKELGAHAVVVGFLTLNGDIDVQRTREAVQAAAPMEVTFHRAFDECRHPLQALEQIIGCGCHRLLTSGCQPSASKGVSMLSQLVVRAGGRIGIIAAAGIVPSNVAEIIQATGVREVHGSCKTTIDGLMVTDPVQVHQLITNAKNQK